MSIVIEFLQEQNANKLALTILEIHRLAREIELLEESILQSKILYFPIAETKN